MALTLKSTPLLDTVIQVCGKLFGHGHGAYLLQPLSKLCMAEDTQFLAIFAYMYQVTYNADDPHYAENMIGVGMRYKDIMYLSQWNVHVFQNF